MNIFKGSKRDLNDYKEEVLKNYISVEEIIGIMPI